MASPGRHASREPARYRMATFLMVGLVSGAALMVALPAQRQTSTAQQQLAAAHSEADSIAGPIADMCAGSKGATIAAELASAHTPDGQSLCPAARQVQTQHYASAPVFNAQDIQKMIHDELARQPAPATVTLTPPPPVPLSPGPVTLTPQAPFPRSDSILPTPTPSPYQRERLTVTETARPAPTVTLTQTVTAPTPATTTVTAPPPVTQTVTAPNPYPTQQATQQVGGASNTAPGVPLLPAIGSLLAGI